MLESYVLERHPSSFSTETYKHKLRAHTYTHHILTDTRKNKWTQDNNITSIIAYTYKNNEREREWQNANASMDLFVYRHNQKHLLINTHTNTRIFNQQINKHKQTIKRREKTSNAAITINKQPNCRQPPINSILPSQQNTHTIVYQVEAVINQALMNAKAERTEHRREQLFRLSVIGNFIGEQSKHKRWNT